MGRVIFDEKDKPLMRMTYQGLWAAISWVTPSPIPVKIFRGMPSAEAWPHGQLQEKLVS